MSQSSRKRSPVFIILIVVALVAFAILLYVERETLGETWDVLLDADPRYIALLPVIQTLNYFFIGEYYRRMFKLFGSSMSKARAWGVVSAMNFVNQVLPSGGISGISYLAYGFRASVDAGKTTLIQLGRYIYAFLSYAILGPIALLIIVLQGNSSEFEGVVEQASDNSAALLVMGTFIGFVLLLGVLITNKKLSYRAGQILQQAVSWLKRNILRRSKPASLEFIKKMHRDFREGVDFIKSHGAKAITPSVFMLSSALCELLIVNVALLAVDVRVSVGAVFIAFVAANIVGVISIIPGDVGVHEATVLIVLTAFGVDNASALSAILLYRVFNKVIFLPVGFYFYTNILKPAVKKAT